MTLTFKRDCPNCGLGVKYSNPEVEAKFPAENLTTNQLQDFFVGFRKDQCFFTYFRCSCGILWCPEYFHQEALDEIYKNIPENTLVSGEVDSVKTQIRYVDLLLKISPINSPILEIGADKGTLIGEIVNRKPDLKAYVIEPNKNVLSHIESKLGNKSSIYSKLSDFPVSIKPRLIIAVHVIDHLIEPKKYIENLSLIASTDVEIFILVHNEKSLLRKIMKERWIPFCLQHPQIFNQKTLGFLLNTTGFEGAKFYKTSNWISLNQVGKILESISILPVNFSSWFPNLAVPIKLGNIAVTAQKQKF